MPPRKHHIFPSWANFDTTPAQNPPFWQPSVATDAHSVAQGGTLSIASYASGNPGPLTFALAPTSTTLTGTGVTFNSAGQFVAVINATIGTLLGLVVRATDVSSGLFTDSPAFALTVVDAPPVWTGPPPSGNNIVQGGTLDISIYVTTGNPPLTYQIDPVLSTVSEATLNSQGITLNHATGVFSATASATVISYPNVVVDATDANGFSSHSFAFPLQVQSAALPWTVYRNYALSNTSPPSGPSVLVAGTNPQVLGPFATYAEARAVTIDNASTPDIIIVAAGSYSDSLSVSGNIKIACLDAVNYATLSNPTSGAGDSSMAPLSNKSVWIENIRFFNFKNTPANCSQVGSSGCVGASFSRTQNLTMHRCLFEECTTGLATGGYIGNLLLVDSEWLNCGSTSTSPVQHSIYLAYGTTGSTPLNPNQGATLIGCKLWFNQDWCSYPAGQEYKVGIGHYVKCDLKTLTVDGCFIKTTTPGGGGSTTCKIQGDSGGLWRIRGNVMEEGRYSAYDPTDSAHGIQPYNPSGFAKCPTSAVTYHNDDNKIIDYSIKAQGGGIFTVPWPVSEIHILQNTIINNGLPTEKVYTNQSLTGGTPSVIEILDNVVAVNAGISDTNPALLPGTTTNTLAPNNSVFVNASADNYQLLTPVAGSAANAPYQYQETNGRPGHVARTDSFRGGVGPQILPLWLQGKPKSTWINVTKTGLLGPTDAAVLHTTYPVDPHGVGGLPDWDPSRTTFYPAGSGYTNGPGFFGLIGSYCGWGVRRNGSWVILFGGGGGTHGLANEIVGASLEADQPTYQTLVRSTTWADMQSQYDNPSANSLYGSPLPSAVSSSTVRNASVGQGTLVTPTVPNGNVYVCSTPGVTGASDPTWPLSYRAKVTDGTAAWTQHAPNPQGYNDGSPLPPQTGILVGFVESIDMLFVPSGVVLGETGGGLQTSWKWGTSTWGYPVRTAADGVHYGSQIPYPEILAANGVQLAYGNRGICIDQDTGTVYLSDQSGKYFKWVPSDVLDNRGTLTNILSTYGISLGSNVGGANAQCWDSKRKHHIFFGKSGIAPPARAVALKAVRVDWSGAAPVVSNMSITDLDGSLAAFSSTDPTNGNNLPGCYTCLCYIPDLPGGGGDYYLFMAGVARGPQNQVPLAQTVSGTITSVCKIIPQPNGTYTMSYYAVSNALGGCPYPSNAVPTGGDTTFDWNRIAYFPNINFVAYQADKGNYGDGQVKDFDIHGFIPE